MRTGNIYKTFHGSVIIINKVTDDYVHWISATHANSSGGTQILTTEAVVDCHCVSECCGMTDLDCPDCNATGKITKITYGMDKATYLADNMFDYIKDRLLKNFDF